MTAPTRYAAEVARLEDVYRDAVAPEPDEALKQLWRSVAGRPVYFTGSGGTLAVAQTAAELHMRTSRRPALALPPMLFAQSPRLDDAAVVLFSARGRNPDAAVALAAARSRGHDPVVVVTTKQVADLPEQITQHRPVVVTVPSPKDGFLATGSVLAAVAALCRTAGMALPEPNDLRWDAAIDLGDRPKLLVLFGGGSQPAATDLETRCSEIGLRSVQAVDYRSFAHGRHTGYWRHHTDTTIVAMIDPPSREVAEATLAALPPEAHIVETRSEHQWPGSLIDLLVWSMTAPLSLAAQGVDPAKPKVAPFGRALYHLPVKEALSEPLLSPAERKLAAGTSRSATMLRNDLSQWLTDIAQHDIGGVVLDFDGTVCDTASNGDLPDSATQDAILCLVHGGLAVGFASGRGKSLPLSLREWIPEDLWPSVTVGVYNAAVTVPLADTIGTHINLSEEILTLAAELRDALNDSVEIEARRLQISLRPPQPTPGEALLDDVAAVLARHGQRYKAVASKHAVDVVRCDVSKKAVLDQIQTRCGDLAVLAVGDQGQRGGNDHELLAATALSLSVDRVSSDPTRCWNLDTHGFKGPALLRCYLDALEIRSGGPGACFVWPAHP